MESLRVFFVLFQEHFLLRLLSRYAQVNSFSFRQIILTKSSQKYTVGKIFTFGSSKNWETLTKSFLFKCFSIELVLLRQGSSFPRNLILASCLAHLIEKILPSHKSHNTPLLPPNFCIGIVFVFSWNIFMQQDEILGRLKKTERPLPEKLRAYF